MSMLDRFTITNGLNVESFHEMGRGSKFIISPKNDKDRFSTPKEIIIDTIILNQENPDDSFTGDNYKIETICGLSFTVSVFFAPNCADWNMYASWKVYFETHFQNIENKRNIILNATNYIEQFENFIKEFGKNNPELLI